MPALPSWLTEPLWDQFAVLLPERPEYHPDHPLGCHRRRISDRIIFDKMLQLLRFGCSYEAIADTTCSATTIRSRRDEWIRLGVFARLKQISPRTPHAGSSGTSAARNSPRATTAIAVLSNGVTTWTRPSL